MSQLEVYLEQFNLEQFVRLCAKRTGFEQDFLEEHVFQVLGAMLEREETFAHAFPNQASFLGYLRKATIRNASRECQKLTAQLPIEEEGTQSLLERQEPQDFYISEEFFAFTSTNKHLPSFIEGLLKKQQIKEKHQHECIVLIQLILDEPETYLQSRNSGPEKGSVTFSFTKIAKKLGWTRRKLYDRIEKIKISLKR